MNFYAVRTTMEEDRQLKEAVKRYVDRNWQNVNFMKADARNPENLHEHLAGFLPERTGAQREINLNSYLRDADRINRNGLHM